jgi:hypothetical protein
MTKSTFRASVASMLCDPFALHAEVLALMALLVESRPGVWA